VAVGGSQYRTLPWGNSEPDPLPANYDANHSTPFLAVGSEPTGRGRWGHLDLTGSLSEWNLDWYVAPFVAELCSNCAVLTEGTRGRVVRGGDWSTTMNYLDAAIRSDEPPETQNAYVGFRCARDAP